MTDASRSSGRHPRESRRSCAADRAEPAYFATRLTALAVSFSRLTTRGATAWQHVAPQPIDDSRDVELLDQLARARAALVEQIGRRIVGQHKIVDDLVAALLAGGHVLLVGVPGLAKTLLVQTVAAGARLSASRACSSRPT